MKVDAHVLSDRRAHNSQKQKPESGYVARDGRNGAHISLLSYTRTHSRVTPTLLRGTWLQLAAWRLQALAIGEGQEIPLDGDHGCRAIVAKWASEGPRLSSAQLRKVA